MALDLEYLQDFTQSGTWNASTGRTAKVTATENVAITFNPDYTADDCSLFFYQTGNKTLTINGQSPMVNPNAGSVTVIRLYWDGTTLITTSTYGTGGGTNGYVQ